VKLPFVSRTAFDERGQRNTELQAERDWLRRQLEVAVQLLRNEKRMEIGLPPEKALPVAPAVTGAKHDPGPEPPELWAAAQQWETPQQKYDDAKRLVMKGRLTWNQAIERLTPRAEPIPSYTVNV
jgi:hypothetical protein